jgi:predicted DCC family thiol-disulfide oxidoreductase YuxK
MARLARLKSDTLELADIHALAQEQGGQDGQPGASAAPLPDRTALLRTLHLRLPDGRLLTGAEANVAAWQYTRHGLWFRWLRWPLLRGLVDRIYDAWARRRYQRLYGRACVPGGRR